MKVFIFLCFVALANAGIIGTDYPPASSASTIYSSINNAPASHIVAPFDYTKTYSAPASVHESILTTHESQTKSLDGTQQNTFAKSLNTPYASENKFESRSTNDGISKHYFPTVYSTPTIHSAHILSQPQTYSVSSPLVHSVSSPVTYTTHTQSAPIVTKTISVPGSATYSGPLLTKTVTPGLSYTALTPIVSAHPGVKITYSEAPLVSHMTFTGLGTSYSW